MDLIGTIMGDFQNRLNLNGQDLLYLQENLSGVSRFKSVLSTSKVKESRSRFRLSGVDPDRFMLYYEQYLRSGTVAFLAHLLYEAHEGGFKETFYKLPIQSVILRHTDRMTAEWLGLTMRQSNTYRQKVREYYGITAKNCLIKAGKLMENYE